MRVAKLLALVMILSAAGCAKRTPAQPTGQVPTPPTQATAKQKTIGISLLTRGHVFYRDLEQGLSDEAAKHGYRLIISAGEWDLSKQTAQVEDYITRKVDAIVVCPVDSAGIVTAIKSANQAKIPVFTADIAAQGGDVVCHIASDNVEGGRKAGEYLAKLLGGKGEVIVIDQPTVTSVLDRVKGFEQALAKYPDIKIVDKPFGAGVRDKAMSATESALTAHPKVAGIFGINDDSALGAMEAVRGAGKKNIVVVGYDATPEARDAILSGGPLKADVIQHPVEIGHRTIQVIDEYFSGKTPPRVIPIPVGMVDKASLEKGTEVE